MNTDNNNNNWALDIIAPENASERKSASGFDPLSMLLSIETNEFRYEFHARFVFHRKRQSRSCQIKHLCSKV